MSSTVLAYGEAAILVSFSQRGTTPIIHDVRSLDQRLLALCLRGIVSTTPSYDSLLVCVDPLYLSLSRLRETINDLLDTPKPPQLTQHRTWELPTCFESAFAEDLPALESELKMEGQHIIESFCSVTYDVRVMGFLPGFTYLGELPQGLRCHRLRTPRARVPASSVAIAGNQAGIYPMDSPGGWRILGRLPFAIFDPSDEQPAMFQPMDQIRFRPITSGRFNEILQHKNPNQDWLIT